ncbi:MAG: hypothetical protein EXS31_15690 [Pedosphaera sp.]|nr:hypothetical protein [Pedosphaera sp.]
MNTTVNKMMTRARRGQWLALILGTVTLVAISRQVRADGGSNDPRVIPPQANFRGLSYGEWEAEWWKGLLAIPVVDDVHPFFTGGVFGGHKGVLFPIAPFGQATVDLTIPAGTPLFLGVMNAECSILEPDPFHGNTEAELRACANSQIDNTSGVFAVIDGIAVQNLSHYRGQSPLFEFGPLPGGNIFEYFGLDAPAGTTSWSVDAGIYLMLAPLRVGRHTIHVGGTYDLTGLSFDSTFNITVVPNKP